MHYGFDLNHTRHAAICSGCGGEWGSCDCGGVYPMGTSGVPLLLEQSQMVNGVYLSRGQYMFCGGCRNLWGKCGCVGFQPVNQYGQLLLFEGVEETHFGVPFDDPQMAAMSVLMSGGSLYEAEVAAEQAEVVREEEELVELAIAEAAGCDEGDVVVVTEVEETYFDGGGFF